MKNSSASAGIETATNSGDGVIYKVPHEIDRKIKNYNEWSVPNPACALLSFERISIPIQKADFDKCVLVTVTGVY